MFHVPTNVNTQDIELEIPLGKCYSDLCGPTLYFALCTYEPPANGWRKKSKMSSLDLSY